MQRRRIAFLTVVFLWQAGWGNPRVFGAGEPPANTSYQILGDWSANDPTQTASFMQETSPGEFEKILKSSGPAVVHLAVVRNHDLGQIVANLTMTVTQEKPQVWRVRYIEKTRRLTCQPEDLVEFRYRPKDDPTFSTNVEVRSVYLAGAFNGWDKSATPMTDLGDGTFVKYLKLDEGVHQYKFVVNGDVWMQDPNSDPSLRVDNGHDSFNSGVFVGEQGKDFGPASPRDINLAAVRHDPNQTSYFNVIFRDTAEVRLRTLHDNVQRVVLHWRDLRDRDIPMQRDGTEFGFDYWDSTVTSEATNKTAYYYFTLGDAVTNRTYAASDGHWFTADLTERFPTPDWARNVVWYQIFVDRFRNGTPENDPPHTLPWRWDWYKLAAWEKPRQDNPQFSNDWYGRRFGGDFQGVLSELPYLHELGVTALYFCPIFESSSNHGYDTVDYRHISQYFGFKGDNEAVIPQETLDPKTWQWTASDKLFLQFIKAAHAQGLKVIIDGVFNHMGPRSFALRDVLANGQKSAYADWFDITDWGPPIRYTTWEHSTLVNFRKSDDKGIASASARQYIFDITRRWMDPNGNGDPTDGIDGWRLDAPEKVPAAFWIDWRKQVKGINSNAYLSGEIWGVATKYLQGNEWDAVMNYQFAMRSIHYFIDQKRKIPASKFDHQLREMLAAYPMQANYVMQNLYDSHDTDRLVSMIANPDRDYNQGDRLQDGAHYDGSKPGPAAYQIQKLMATFQMTFLGAPMIWYGDEAGMFGAGDPVDRKQMLWRDLEPYDNPQDAVMPDLLEHYRRVIAIRNTYPALRTGRFHTWVTDDPNDIYGFTRTRGDEVIAVVVNNSDRDQTLTLPSPFPDGSKLVDVMNAAPVDFVMAPMESLGFPNFEKGAMVRAIHIGPKVAPVYIVHDGKIGIGVSKKSAAILVRE
jgi:glycosidase